MPDVDIELELQVLRVNVGGIIGDVREAIAQLAEPEVRYDRLRERLKRIDERLAALELRCCCQSLATGDPDR